MEQGPSSDFATFQLAHPLSMPPKANSSRKKDQKCPRCSKFFTSRGIIAHLNLCTVADTHVEDPSRLIASFTNNILQESISNLMETSDTDKSVSDDPISTNHESQHSNDVAISDMGADFVDEIMAKNNEFDSEGVPFGVADDVENEQEEGDWWTEYTITEGEATNEAGVEESEEFDALLCWIDKEMLLELSRDGMSRLAPPL